MGREEVIHTLHQHMPEIRGFGVSRLAVFGSLARGEERPGSDVDILVEFSVPVGLFEFVRTQRYLAGLLGRAVDLATPDAIREEMRERILREAAYVAQGLEDARPGYSRGHPEDTTIHERGLAGVAARR